MSGKKVSGTFCAKHPEGEFLAKGTGYLFPARSLVHNLHVIFCLNERYYSLNGMSRKSGDELKLTGGCNHPALVGIARSLWMGNEARVCGGDEMGISRMPVAHAAGVATAVENFVRYRLIAAITTFNRKAIADIRP